MDEAELAGRILCRLALVRSALGEQAYEDAVRRALAGIGHAVHAEAERRARAVGERRTGGSVSIPHPDRDVDGNAS
jgi:hypothetical protein